MKADTLK